jgi:hypothetical protein
MTFLLMMVLSRTGGLPQSSSKCLFTNRNILFQTLDLEILRTGEGLCLIVHSPPVSSRKNLKIIAGCDWIHEADFSARIYRSRFRENKPKTLVFSHWKQAFWLGFVKTGSINSGTGPSCKKSLRTPISNNNYMILETTRLMVKYNLFLTRN